jgi:hypothetical protein
MSTKIYTGIRFRRSKLDEFIHFFHGACIGEAANYTKEVMATVSADAVAEKMTDIHKDRGVCEQRIRCAIAFSEFIRSSEKQYAYNNIDCWVNVYPKGRFFYAIPEYPSRNIPTYPDWVEEYGYWNNTDPLEHLTSRQWRRRKENWEVALDQSGDQWRLTHVVIEGKNWRRQGLETVEKEIFGDFNGYRAYFVAGDYARKLKMEEEERRKK